MLFYFICVVAEVSESFYLGRLKYLAIVVDSKEAKSTEKVKRLLRWLSSMGVKYVCLYDIEGKTMSSTFEFAVYGCFQFEVCC